MKEEEELLIPVRAMIGGIYTLPDAKYSRLSILAFLLEGLA